MRALSPHGLQHPYGLSVVLAASSFSRPRRPRGIFVLAAASSSWLLRPRGCPVLTASAPSSSMTQTDKPCMNKARQRLAVLFNHGICQISKKLVPNADKGKRKCDSAQPKCGSCSYSSLEYMYTAQAYVDRNEVNLSSRLTDEKYLRYEEVHKI